MPGWACGNDSAPVSAASVKPRSGSGIVRKYSVISRSLALRPCSKASRSSSRAKPFMLPAGSAFRIVLLAVTLDPQRARGKPALRTPVDEAVFLAVRYPDLSRAGRRDRRGQSVPIRVVGDHERQLDPALPRPRAHPHPSGRESPDRIGKPPRPDLPERGRRAQHDRAGKLGFGGLRRGTQFAEFDAAARVIAGERIERAVPIDRFLAAPPAHQPQPPLPPS